VRKSDVKIIVPRTIMEKEKEKKDFFQDVCH
jgi:hypothetical protein